MLAVFKKNDKYISDAHLDYNDEEYFVKYAYYTDDLQKAKVYNADKLMPYGFRRLRKALNNKFGNGFEIVEVSIQLK